MKAFLRLALVITSLLSVSVQAAPIGFDFYQGGYAGGGYVSGWFSGNDLDGNGQLSSFAGEISGFTMQFSGSEWVPQFVLGLEDLFGLVYDINAGPLGDGISQHIEGILAFNDADLYAAGPGPTWSVCGVGVPCAGVLNDHHFSYSAELVQVTSTVSVAVPEPGSVGLIVLGVVCLLVARRRMNPGH
jgi:hypothetical protein